jgi:hypothetical protein
MMNSRLLVTLTLVVAAPVFAEQSSTAVGQPIQLNCPAGTVQRGDKVSKDNGVFCVKVGTQAGQESMRHGPYVDFWPNGQKQSEGVFQDGFQFGRWTFWNADGVKTSEIDFSRSVYHGTRVEYHANGNKKLVQSWVKGKQDGIETMYAEDGQKVAESEFRDGHRTKAQRFENGRPVAAK